MRKPTQTFEIYWLAEGRTCPLGGLSNAEITSYIRLRCLRKDEGPSPCAGERIIEVLHNIHPLNYTPAET